MSSWLDPAVPASLSFAGTSKPRDDVFKLPRDSGNRDANGAKINALVIPTKTVMPK